MITRLNYNTSNGLEWTHIYKIDMTGIHPDQEPEEYFSVQLDHLVSQELEKGFELKGMTQSFGYNWILVFNAVEDKR